MGLPGLTNPIFRMDPFGSQSNATKNIRFFFLLNSPIDLNVIYDAFSSCCFFCPHLCLLQPQQKPVKLSTTGTVQKKKEILQLQGIS